MENNLALVSTEDMITELQKRFDGFIVSGIRQIDTKGNYLALRRYSGNRYVCLGMLSILTNIVSSQEFLGNIPAKGEV